VKTQQLNTAEIQGGARVQNCNIALPCLLLITVLDLKFNE